MDSNITNRIASETGIPRLLPALAEEISPSDLQSLLLAVYQNRAKKVRESGLMARTGNTPLVAASNIDARLLNQFDRIAFAAAEQFEAVDLSPVCSFGTHSTLGGVDQNNVLTTVRNAELLGDSTPALALECARRRKNPAHRPSTAPVRLCSSHRVVRLQPFDFPGYTPHFRLFSLVSAGRDTGSNSFEFQHLGEHIRFYLRLFRSLNQNGFSLASPLVEISDLRVTEALLASHGISRDQVRESVRAHVPGSGQQFLSEKGIELAADADHPLKAKVLDGLKADFPETEFRFNLARLEGLGYYSGLCLRISPEAPDGACYPIVDGGLTTWTARLLQDRKERLLSTAIGSEFVCRRYRRNGREGTIL